ncbi:hypothetical protein CNMCM5793_002442 [Aspergillus hiratsukae]|uniref:Rhodopsin domain-containing protein n=1 Tax=Aspergillus hiratsukae TaxID=1194566 RepID=A0A8H6UPG5_9EURO|nr:hypothetical protein CNMCM5793_002442 [Aspergillus hiratsukae]KAF7158660.1 hypothetical protein CNMCM6106_005450 [Aspergillus hiratsukae]
MCVPFPLVLAAGIATSQKVVLCILFSSGIFVMIAACLRAYYSVKDIDTLATALGWASREALVSVIIVCAPGIKPLFARIGWFRSYGSSNIYDNTSKSRNTGFRSRGTKHPSAISATNERHPYELSPHTGWKKGRQGSSGESQELIIEATPRPNNHGDSPDRGITVRTDVTLAHEDTHSNISL